MRFCILIFLFSGWALAQSPTQGTWSADNDTPPGLEEARAKNYEETHRPPEKHPPAYYTTDYYEYQVDRNVTFESHQENASPKEEDPQESRESKTKTEKFNKNYAGGGYVQGRRITSRNCTYTCNKKLPSKRRTIGSNKKASKGLKYNNSNSFWSTGKSKKYTFSKTYYKKRSKPSSYSFFKKKRPKTTVKKQRSPIITKRKHTKKPSISKKLEGSSLR